jgi:hypothetical protein
MEGMTRRRFIGGTAALVGAHMLGGCGHEQDQNGLILPNQSPEF